MKTLLISAALFTAPFAGSVAAQTTTSTLTQLVSEQDRQILELKKEVSDLRSRLNLERRKNGKTSLPIKTIVKESSNSRAVTSDGSHTVKSGDTFSSISRKYGVSVSALIVANPKIQPTLIRPGQKIIIPKANSRAVASAPRQTSWKQTKKATTSTSKATIGSNYKVAKGETLFGIAKKHNISYASIKAANPGLNPRKMRIGQVINLTKSASTQSVAMKSFKSSNKKKSKPITKTKSKKIAYETLPPVNTVSSTSITSTVEIKKPVKKEVESYVKQSDDVARTVPVSTEMTFGEFAKKHGTSISVLNALNGLDLSSDYPMAAGSELFIPNK